MPRGDIVSEAGGGGKGGAVFHVPSTSQEHIQKYFYAWSLCVIFSSCDIRRLHFLSRDMHILKTKDARFDSKEQGRFKRNGPNLISERMINFSAYQVQ